METQKKTRPWYKKWWIITLLVIFVAPPVLGTIFAVPGAIKQANDQSGQRSSDPKPAQSKQTKIKYIQPRWEITKAEIVGSNYIVASGYLLNISEETGVADCNIEFYDREVKWAGGKGFGGRELKPNERYDFTVQVEVDNTGLISKQNIDCEDGVY